MVVKYQNFVLFLLAAWAFVISVVVAPYHIAGDQVHYNKVYFILNGTNIWTARQLYLQNIFSVELTHFLVTWAFSNLGFNKVLAMSALNSLLAFLSGKFLMTKTRNYLIISLMLITNVYLYTMFFTLEKLKVGFIFLLLAIVYQRKLWLVLSAIAHAQIFFILANFIASRHINISKFFTIQSVGKNWLIGFMILALLFALLYTFSYDYILVKFLFYSANSDSLGLSPAVLCALLGCFTLCFTSHRSTCFSYFFILCCFIILVGAERLNMFAVFGFYYFARFRRINESNGIFFVVGLLLLSTYLAYKSIIYLNVVILYGG